MADPWRDLTLRTARDRDRKARQLQAPARVTAECNPCRQAALRVRERLMTLGGFQRTERGGFWIDRDDVLRLMDEEFAGVEERRLADHRASKLVAAEGARARYRKALEHAADVLADPNAMAEPVDSPANMAYAIVMSALDDGPATNQQQEPEEGR